MTAQFVSALDERMVVWLNQLVARWPLLDSFLWWLSWADLIKFVPFILVICWLWFLQDPRQRLYRRLLLMTVLTAFIALFSGRVLALTLPFRARPFENPDLHLVLSYDPDLGDWSAFPSDHAIMAFAIAA